MTYQQRVKAAEKNLARRLKKQEILIVPIQVPLF